MLKNRKKKKSEPIQRSSVLDRFTRKKEVQKPSDLSYLFEALQKYSKRHWYHTFENAECVKCSEVDKIMVTVGAMKFCTKCFENEFDSKAEVRNEDKYQKWYKVYQEKIELWFKDQDAYEVSQKHLKKERKIKRRKK